MFAQDVEVAEVSGGLLDEVNQHEADGEHLVARVEPMSSKSWTATTARERSQADS